MAKVKKKNCWEVMRCGREMGGHNKELNVCPAAVTAALHKTHGGTHAGRACWVVAGTMCGGNPQGTFAQKYKNCELCKFYKMVKKEEGTNFQYSVVLIAKLREGKIETAGNRKQRSEPTEPWAQYPERN